MKVIDEIEENVKNMYGSWTEYSRVIGKDKKNIKRQIASQIHRLNKILDPLSLEVSVKEILRSKTPSDLINQKNKA